MAARPKLLISEEEYLARERAGDTKHEYWGGEVVAMVGASESHALIVTSTSFSLYGQLRRRPCNVYTNDMRVKVTATGVYTYPDLVVVCGEPRFADDHFDGLLNPTVIIEVLSPSTEADDRGKKWRQGRALDSLQDYLLIAQNAPHVTHHSRGDDDAWRTVEIDGPAATVALASIGCTLALADIYEKVDLPR